jgi:hypothetical protein
MLPITFVSLYLKRIGNGPCRKDQTMKRRRHAEKQIIAILEEPEGRDEEGPSRKKMVTPAAERGAVAHLSSAFDMSERQACSVIGCV